MKARDFQTLTEHVAFLVVSICIGHTGTNFVCPRRGLSPPTDLLSWNTLYIILVHVLLETYSLESMAKRNEEPHSGPRPQKREHYKEN